ncbi:hypothetical protein NQ176_g5030 [Zarea fungicola]|uniref:Uncharacterized protein n=1 Tax=Zarea fungicola TaxID=93591 RepID=A0ACC1NCG6_9HYPO|nr:hypothetical protein NQ176_g5030 [Lecanicillium fungicola]
MATTGGLFGAASTQPKTGGLFGASTTQAAPAAGAGGGLFGAAQQKPATGGLFGTPAATTTQQPQQQGQTATAPGGLFGAASTQTATNTAGSGLFGGAGATQQPAQSSSGLFGASTATAQTGAPTSTFGQTQPKPSGGLFGQIPQQTQPTNQVSAVQINYDTIRPRSRFDDLAQPIQDEVALIDKGIQRVIKMRDEIGEFMPQHEKDIEQLGHDVKYVEAKFRLVQEALNRDIQTVKNLQDVTKKNIGDAQLSFKAADNLKLPSHYHQTGLLLQAPQRRRRLLTVTPPRHMQYKKRLDEYRSEIERDMPGVENGLYDQIRNFRDRNAAMNGSGTAVQDQLTQVLSALRETGNAIVGQAGQIADTRERLSRLQAGFQDSGLYTNN